MWVCSFAAVFVGFVFCLVFGYVFLGQRNDVRGAAFAEFAAQDGDDELGNGEVLLFCELVQCVDFFEGEGEFHISEFDLDEGFKRFGYVVRDFALAFGPAADGSGFYLETISELFAADV